MRLFRIVGFRGQARCGSGSGQHCTCGGNSAPVIMMAIITAVDAIV